MADQSDPDRFVFVVYGVDDAIIPLSCSVKTEFSGKFLNAKRHGIKREISDTLENLLDIGIRNFIQIFANPFLINNAVHLRFYSPFSEVLVHLRLRDV